MLNPICLYLLPGRGCHELGVDPESSFFEVCNTGWKPEATEQIEGVDARDSVASQHVAEDEALL